MDDFLWPSDTKAARQIQERLRERIVIGPPDGVPSLIAGVDAAFDGRQVFAVACLYRFSPLAPVEDAHAIATVSFPYVPGYLSFREGPAIVEAIRNLSERPDIILLDGQGIAHPRGIGLASHIGVVLDIPSIGCAKSRLVGEYREPGAVRGSWSPLVHEDRAVGVVLRTRDGVKPLLISPGHRIDPGSAVSVVLSCCVRYRNPEPLRRADRLSKWLKKKSLS